MSLCTHAQSLLLHLTLCDPMGSSLLGSWVHGMFPARILEWVALPPSRGCSWPRDWTCVSCGPCTAGEHLIIESHWGSHMSLYIIHLSKHRESTISRVSLNVNYELWVIIISMYIYLWQKKKKNTTLVSDTDNGVCSPCVGTGVIWEISVLPSQSGFKPKTSKQTKNWTLQLSSLKTSKTFSFQYYRYA